ncbi:MAG TPA: hypothetical protein ENK57_19805, partial [Polyangiaceae bacterium]|nr:hypothetical protein [Polyangiaceae bacterium]
VIAEPFDRGLRIWDVATGAERLHVQTPADELLHVAVHPDGRRVATADGEVDSALRLWDAHTGAELAVFEGHGGRIRGLEFDASGRWLVSASDDGVVRRAREVEGAWRSEVLDTDAGAVTAIAVADGWLFVLAADRPLWALELDAGGAPRRWDLQGDALAVTPDGRAAVAELDGTIGVYRLADAAVRELLLDPGDPPISLAFARDGATLYCASEGQMVLGFDMRDGRVVKRLTGHSSWVNALAVSPVAPLLASASEDHTIRLWNTATAPEPDSAERTVVRGTAVAPSGRAFATVDFAGRLRLRDFASEELRLEVDVPAEHVHAVALDEARGWLACDARERVLVAPLDGGAPRLFDGAHQKRVLGLALDQATGRLASCSADGSLAVWDVAVGAVEVRATTGGGRLWSVAWSPSGDRVVAAGDDGHLRVWSVPDGQLVLDAQADANPICAVDWSPDGARIATGGWGRALRLFDAETGEPLRELTGHSMLIYDIAFSPDGRRLASVSSDRSVMLWDPEAGHDLLTIRTLHEPCFAAAWSPAGDALVVGTAGGTRILRAAPR